MTDVPPSLWDCGIFLQLGTGGPRVTPVSWQFDAAAEVSLGFQRVSALLGTRFCRTFELDLDILQLYQPIARKG